MADGHSGILAHEHHRGRFTDDEATPDDDGVLALAVDAVVVQDLHAGGGGAGGKAQIAAALEHTGVRQVGHAVDVLLRVEAVADLILVGLEMLRQRTEHQNAVDGVVGVDLVDELEQVLLGGILRQDKLLYVDADELGALRCALLIGQIAGVLAHADDAERGNDALFLQRICALDELCIQRIGNFFAQ